MTQLDFRAAEAEVEGLAGFERLQALQAPFYQEWKQRGSSEEACLALLKEVTAGQRHLLTTWWVEGEVGNGGLAAVFYNSTGSYFPEILEGLEALEANGHAALLRRAAALLFPGGEVPRSTEERNDLISDSPVDEDEVDAELEALDDAWFAQELKLEDALNHLVAERPGDFIR